MNRIPIAAAFALALGLALSFSPARAAFPRTLIMEVVDIDGGGGVTLRDYSDKESNEWAAPATLFLSSPDEPFPNGELYEITIAGPL